ncbi:ATP-binding cassette domain-containing protein [Litorimonas sp. WD9-15]|uniref:ATP-binding cassette domain-containing protein n=1 Tax=Litorimonas sp. WD9-15 TaxID=3418716 RepID=UPI003D01D85D
MTLIFENVEIHTPDGTKLLQIPSVSLGTGLIALTGGNGAGKSTLIRTIFGLHPLKTGSIKFQDLDSRKQRAAFLKASIYQFQNFTAYPELTGLEFLVHAARLRGVGKNAAKNNAKLWMSAVGLGHATTARTRAYSQGMLQRLGLAYVLQIETPFCVLDEPFAGVDPSGRAALGQLLREAAEKRIILISTHYSDELKTIGAGEIHIENKTLTVKREASV